MGTGQAPERAALRPRDAPQADRAPPHRMGATVPKAHPTGERRNTDTSRTKDIQKREKMYANCSRQRHHLPEKLLSLLSEWARFVRDMCASSRQLVRFASRPIMRPPKEVKR